MSSEAICQLFSWRE